MTKIKDMQISGPFFDFRTGSVQDNSDSHFSVTVDGTPHWEKDNGRVLVFNGSSNLNIGNYANFDYDETVSFIVKFKTTSETTEVFASKSDGATTYRGWNLFMDANGKISFRIYYDGVGDGIQVQTDDTFNDGKWHICICTYDGSGDASGVKFYVDGENVSDTDVNDVGFGGSVINTSSWTLGESSYGSLNYTGLMAYFLQLSVELTPSQTSQLYEELLQEGHYDRVDIRKMVDPARNIMPDGDMEKDGTTDFSTGAGATLSKEPSDIGEGKQCLRVTKTGANDWGISSGYDHYTKYRIRGYARSDGNGSAEPSILYLGKEFWRGTTSTDWQYFDEVFTFPADDRVFLSMRNGSNTHYVEFDNIQLTKVPNVDDVYITDGSGWNESFANETVGFLSNTGWTINSGTWKINTDKQIECVSDGQIQIDGMKDADTWTTDTFELISGNPTLTKNNGNLQIDAVAGNKVGTIILRY